MSTPKVEKDLHLPLSRVKTIMKSSPDVDAVGPEPLYLVTKVTALHPTAKMEGPLKKLATRASETLGSNSNQRRPLHPNKKYNSSSTGRESFNQFVKNIKPNELFVTDLAKRAYKNTKNNFLEYKHIAEVVQEDDTLDFLREIMPRKITVRQYKELMAKKAAKGSDTDDESSETSEETSSEESSSSEEQD